MKFTVYADKPSGEVKPLNGVCNGPSKTTAKYYKKAGIPFARLHDMRTHFHDICDVPAIFKNFDADENDPGNYDFVLSDYYIGKIRECGTDIVYRLGRSMNTGDFRWDNEPPKDFAKWARICEHIIMHYNRGWADGHEWNIKYFEIWNEPDGLNPKRELDGQWTGTPEQFYEFYSVAAKHLKSCFPEYYFGGYASCNIISDGRREFCDGFLKYQSGHKTPIDFLSWHCYAERTDGIVQRSEFVRSELDKYGYKDTFQICTEWNYFWQRPGMWAEFELEGSEYTFEELFREASGARGAAYSLAAMMTFQKCGVEIATLHRADALSMYCTFFNVYGVPQKQYDAFLIWNELRKLGNVIKTEPDGEGDGTYAVAAEKDGALCIAVSRYAKSADEVTFEFSGLDKNKQYEAVTVTYDERHGEICSKPESVCGKIDVHIAGESVLIVKISEK